MTKELSLPMRGIIPPLVTPLTEANQLDVEALARLIEHQIDGGVHGLFLLGTTGEGPSLGIKVRRDMIRHCCRIVDSRIPILVAITDTSLDESVALAQFANEHGVTAVVAAPTYYYSLTQDELLAYFRQLNARLPLPLVLYNMPATTQAIFAPETLQQLLNEESIVGLKDSSGDLDYFKQLIDVTEARPDFPLMVGPEHLLGETLVLGGQGGVAGGANIWPQPFVELYNAAISNKPGIVASCTKKIGLLGEIYRVGPFSIPGIIARTKAALSLLGICDRTTAPPILPVNADELMKIEAILDQLGLTSESQQKPSCFTASK